MTNSKMNEAQAAKDRAVAAFFVEALSVLKGLRADWRSHQAKRAKEAAQAAKRSKRGGCGWGH